MRPCNSDAYLSIRPDIDPGIGVMSSFGILESPSAFQFETIGIVIVRSASPLSGNEKLLNSLQSCLAQCINMGIFLRFIPIRLCIVLQRELGINPDDLCSFCTGLFFSAHNTVCDGQMDMGYNVIRRTLNGCFKCGNRLLHSPYFAQSLA